MSTAEAVTGEDNLVELLGDNDDLNLQEGSIREVWDIWQTRNENGQAGVLVSVPDWFAGEEFGARRPLLFAQIEHDDPEKGAVLFSSTFMLDISIVENEVWEQVTLTETLDQLDMSDDNEYIDEPGLVWIPRSLMSVYELDG